MHYVRLAALSCMLRDKLFTLVFGDRKDAVILACKMISENYTQEIGSF